MFKKVLLTTTLLLISFTSHCLQQNKDFTSYFQQKNPPGWSLSGDALYTKSSNADFNGYLYSPRWNWGFKLKAEYGFSKIKSISLSWLKFSDVDNTNEDVLTNIFGEGETNIIASYKEILNIINLDFNQAIDFNDRIVFALVGGIQYFKYNRSLAIEFQSPVSLSELNSNAIFTYHGTGPRIGVGFVLALFDNIHIISNVAYSSIFYRIGKKTIDIHHLNRTNPNTINNSFTDIKEDRGPIGGEDGELGVSYHKHLSQSDLFLKFAVLGIAYDVDDTRYEMFTLGAKWRANI